MCSQTLWKVDYCCSIVVVLLLLLCCYCSVVIALLLLLCCCCWFVVSVMMPQMWPAVLFVFLFVLPFFFLFSFPCQPVPNPYRIKPPIFFFTFPLTSSSSFISSFISFISSLFTHLNSRIKWCDSSFNFICFLFFCFVSWRNCACHNTKKPCIHPFISHSPHFWLHSSHFSCSLTLFNPLIAWKSLGVPLYICGSWIALKLRLLPLPVPFLLLWADFSPHNPSTHPLSSLNLIVSVNVHVRTKMSVQRLWNWGEKKKEKKKSKK